jgi:hypothetical protein
VKTLEQKAREFKELKRIEAALAKERMLAGKKIDPGKNFSVLHRNSERPAF